MRKIKFLSVFVAVFGLIYVVSSCNKKKDTIVKVNVYDANKDAINNATVILYAKPTGNYTGKKVMDNDTSYTNVNGEAIFNLNYLYELGQSGVAILNIKAEKDTLNGEGIIQVVEESTVDTDVSIQ